MLASPIITLQKPNLEWNARAWLLPELLQPLKCTCRTQYDKMAPTSWPTEAYVSYPIRHDNSTLGLTVCISVQHSGNLYMYTIDHVFKTPQASTSSLCHRWLETGSPFTLLRNIYQV